MVPTNLESIQRRTSRGQNLEATVNSDGAVQGTSSLEAAAAAVAAATAASSASAVASALISKNIPQGTSTSDDGNDWKHSAVDDNFKQEESETHQKQLFQSEGHNGTEPVDFLIAAGLYKIESSAAYRALNLIKKKKVVSKSIIDDLQKRHLRLYQNLVAANEHEKIVVKRARGMQGDVARRRLAVEKASTKAYDDTAEISALRRELVSVQSELVLAQERADQHARDLESTAVAHSTMSEHIEEIRRHKTDMLEPQLVSSTRELRLMVLQRRQQVSNLRKELDDKDALYERAVAERDALLVDREAAETELARLSEQPLKLRRQNDVAKEAINNLMLELQRQSAAMSARAAELEAVQRRRKACEDERASLALELERSNEVGERSRQEGEVISRQLQQLQADIAGFTETREEIAREMQETERDLRVKHDRMLHSTHTKDSLVKAYRKLDMATNAALSRLPASQQKHREIQLSLQVSKREAAHYRNEIRNLRREIEALICTHLDTEMAARGESQQVQTRVAQNRDLEKQLESATSQAAELERLVHQEEHQRELKTREVLRLTTKLRKLREELQAAEIAAEDAHKKKDDAATKLTACVRRYDGVKSECSRLATTITGAEQRGLEMCEKTRILSGEVAILRSKAESRRRALALQHKENADSYQRRDALKKDANAVRKSLVERQHAVEEMAGRIDTLTTMLDTIAGELKMDKRRYEQVVAERNAYGLQLLEYNDELCMLLEKKNSFEKVHTQGDHGLMRLEAQERSLRLVLSEVQRSLIARRKMAPEIAKLRTEYAQLRKEVQAARQQVTKLTAAVETPREERVRELGGRDPPQEDLDKRVRVLEGRVALADAALLDKNLFSEELRLDVARLQEQTTTSRERGWAALAALNKLTRKLRAVSKSSMATFAEIKIAREEAQKLADDIAQRRDLAARAYTACEKLSDQNDACENVAVEEFEVELGAATARQRKAQPHVESPQSERRPVSYMPKGKGALPVTEPYGQFPPFMPYYSAANYEKLRRYFRRPTFGPIEL